ncbi:MAG: IS66 family transposase [Rhodocyclaceae bacterium]|nr:IS66 family transposase [Rhodocyclaceae bacterium]
MCITLVMKASPSVQPTAHPTTAAQTVDWEAAPFSREPALISRAEEIELRAQANFWKAQHQHATQTIARLEQEALLKDATIKDLRNRLFGKKSEKDPASSEAYRSQLTPLTSIPGGAESGQSTSATRPRGQQPGRPGHGRTPPSPNLPVAEELIEWDGAGHCCPNCGLPPLPCAALDEVSDIKEVEVKAFIRRVRRKAYVPGCRCSGLPPICIAPPVPRLIPRSPYGVSFWVDLLVSKFHYHQPIHRRLRDLRDQGMPVSPGTVAGDLQALVPLFQPLIEALYCHQMGEPLFNGDESRWEVFVQVDGKSGSRWYLWVFRSASVIFYSLDPSRSAAVPGAHFAGLQAQRVILVCDRYSAYKKLARLSAAILLAFCWAHVRRDFLEAGRSLPELEAWALAWKGRIGTLYHLNRQRLEHWQSELPGPQQSEAFQGHQQRLAAALEEIQAEAQRLATPEPGKGGGDEVPSALSKTARHEQRKIARSLLNHWDGLRLFLDHPEVPMDNNRAENAIRGPVTGRKNYYGSGSLLSAELAATQFSLFQTLALWDIPVRPWLTRYLQACAENGGQPPADISPFLPWSLAATPRDTMRRPPPTPSNDSS